MWLGFLAVYFNRNCIIRLINVFQTITWCQNDNAYKMTEVLKKEWNIENSGQILKVIIVHIVQGALLTKHSDKWLIKWKIDGCFSWISFCHC